MITIGVLVLFSFAVFVYLVVYGVGSDKKKKRFKRLKDKLLEMFCAEKIPHNGLFWVFWWSIPDEWNKCVELQEGHCARNDRNHHKRSACMDHERFRCTQKFWHKFPGHKRFQLGRNLEKLPRVCSAPVQKKDTANNAPSKV